MHECPGQGRGGASKQNTHTKRLIVTKKKKKKKREAKDAKAKAIRPSPDIVDDVKAFNLTLRAWRWKRRTTRLRHEDSQWAVADRPKVEHGQLEQLALADLWPDAEDDERVWARVYRDVRAEHSDIGLVDKGSDRVRKAAASRGGETGNGGAWA